jgi:threonine/homoserine/homoserine lactone efflux protein
VGLAEHETTAPARHLALNASKSSFGSLTTDRRRLTAGSLGGATEGLPSRNIQTRAVERHQPNDVAAINISDGSSEECDAEPNQLLAFVGISVAVVVVPGPDMALVARNVVRYGAAAGYATAMGVCTGILGWALAAALGVSTLLAASTTAFTVLKLAGAVYLVFLGISTLRGGHRSVESGPRRRHDTPGGQPWAQGLVSALLNPKLGVFFLTLLPQFVPPGAGGTGRLFALAIVFDLIGLAWLLTYSALLGAAGAALQRPRAQRLLRIVSGSVLVGLGGRLALERS